MAVLNLADITAVVVTRGDVPLDGIGESLEVFGQSCFWDNSKGEDLAVFGRYAALAEVGTDVVAVQDDDVILPFESWQALADAYEPGVLVANMPARFREQSFYAEHCLVGFGAIFDRSLPGEAFDPFVDAQYDHLIPRVPEDLWNRTCDIVFTALTERKLVDVPYRDMPWASVPGRMWTSPGHVEERQRMLDLVLKVRDG